jgi:hypothetical protein
MQFMPAGHLARSRPPCRPSGLDRVYPVRDTEMKRLACGEFGSGYLYVFVSDYSALRSLQEHLRRADCIAEQARADELEVYVPSAPNDREGRRELDKYLSIWQARNVGVEVYVVDR